jgi:hypothetical protein
MERSAHGADPRPASPGAGNGQGDSALAALSGIADRVRAVADERLGPGAAGRLRTVAEEKLKSVGGDRLPPAAAERLRSVTSGRGDAAGAAVPAPPFEERPELYVGAAFAGGVVLAAFIRLLGR